MKKIILLFLLSLTLVGCGNGKTTSNSVVNRYYNVSCDYDNESLVYHCSYDEKTWDIDITNTYDVHYRYNQYYDTTHIINNELVERQDTTILILYQYNKQ